MDIYVYTILSDDNVVEVGRYRSNVVPRADERVSLRLHAHGESVVTTWRVMEDGVLYAIDKESVALTVSPLDKEAQAYCKRLSKQA